MGLFGRRRAREPELGAFLHALFEEASEARGGRKAHRAGGSPRRGGSSIPAAQLRGPEAFRLPEGAEAESLLLLARPGLEIPAFALLCSPAEAERGLGALGLLCRLSGGEGAAGAYLLSGGPARAGELEALIPRMGSSVCYELPGRLLLAEAGAARALERRLREPGFEEALRAARAAAGEASEGEAKAGGGASGIEIEKPSELVISRLFLPPRYGVGGLELGVFWEGLSLEAEEGGRPEPELWFAAGAGRPGTELYFSCPAPREGGEAYATRVLSLLRPGWTRAAAALAGGRAGQESGAGPLLARVEPPGPARLAGGLLLHGELCAGAGRLRLGVHLPPAFLRLLSRASGAAAEVFVGPEPIGVFLAANEALLARWREGNASSYLSHRAPAGASRPPGLPTIPSILGYLGRREGALLVQNCLLPALGPRELPRLFFRKPEGEGAARLLPLEPFSERALLGLLPPLAAEEWQNEVRSRLGEGAWGAEEALRANEAAARLIHAALAGGRLALSPASSALLEAELGARILEEGRAELEALAAEGLPYGILEGLAGRELQRLLGPFSNTELAQGLLGDEGRLPLLKKAMSRSRQLRFAEELEAVRKRFERGELPAAELARAKRRLGADLGGRLGRLREEGGR